MQGGNLRYQFTRLSIAEKLIAVNVLVFIVFRLTAFLMDVSPRFLEQWFELPRDVMAFLSQPWSIISYSFLHGGLWHLFFNMLLLFYVGRIFMNIYGPRRFVNVYFLGVILGGAFFLLSYNLFPVFHQSQAPLIGASAGVMAVLIYICTYMPNQEVRVFFFNLKLWYIGAFFVVLDLVLIPAGDNPGGRIAHLGGALLGYLYARAALQGRDLGAGFSGMLDWLAGLFEKKPRKAPMKTVYRKQAKKTPASVDYDKATRQRKIDTILDKISKSGYESLTQAEKDFLFKAGKED